MIRFAPRLERHRRDPAIGPLVSDREEGRGLEVERKRRRAELLALERDVDAGAAGGEGLARERRQLCLRGKGVATKHHPVVDPHVGGLFRQEPLYDSGAGVHRPGSLRLAVRGAHRADDHLRAVSEQREVRLPGARLTTRGRGLENGEGQLRANILSRPVGLRMPGDERVGKRAVDGLRADRGDLLRRRLRRGGAVCARCEEAESERQEKEADTHGIARPL